MNSQIKSILNPTLYNAFLELSKDDIILQQVIKNTDDTGKFVNSLLAAIICISEREKQTQQTMIGILQANPAIKKILELRNDPSLLSKK